MNATAFGRCERGPPGAGVLIAGLSAAVAAATLLTAAAPLLIYRSVCLHAAIACYLHVYVRGYKIALV